MASRLASLHRKHRQEQLGKRLQSEGRESTLLWIKKMWFHFVLIYTKIRSEHKLPLPRRFNTEDCGGPGDLQEVLEPTVILHL